MRLASFDSSMVMLSVWFCLNVFESLFIGNAQCCFEIQELTNCTVLTQMVPIKEMTDVLKVVKETANLKPKTWVRLKRGVFKDDLAQVCLNFLLAMVQVSVSLVL